MGISAKVMEMAKNAKQAITPDGAPVEVAQLV